jgi:hypothetical protein
MPDILSPDNILPLAFFLTDAMITSIAAWLVVCAGGHGGRGCLEAGLAWLWSFIALIAGAGVVLGLTGGFGAMGFLAFHGAVLAGLVIARRRWLTADFAALGSARRQTRQFFDTPGGDRLLGLGLLALLLGLTVLAAWAKPDVRDALTYHLPRIGHWLQDGEIRILGTTETRMNYMAVLPEIVMAWLVGSMREGFHLAIVAQAIGGIMAVGATVGLARQSGLGRSAALLAGGLLLGMANVVVEFTAAQTDLFTAGVFAVSFYLWLAALRRGESSPLGALGAGLSLGAKGTLFFMFPSGLLWVAWLAWHHRMPWPQWRRTLLIAVLGIGLFALPGFVRNWQAYGHALGPEAYEKEIQPGFDSISGQWHKVCLNLASSLAQNFDPQSQPYGLRTISRTVGMTLVQQLPAKDNYTLPDFDRKKTLAGILLQAKPWADTTSFGDITLLLFSAGSLIALVQWKHGNGRLVLVWSAGVAMFLIFYNIIQQWHPYIFRYYVLVAPWVAIIAAWGIEQAGRRWRMAVWTVVAAGTLDVGWYETTHALEAGWQSIVQSEPLSWYLGTMGWRAWSQHLDHAGEPFLLALPKERPIAAFYRQWPRREVLFKPDPGNSVATAEDFVRGETGWVIVPATRFLGREGRVAASVVLCGGDETNGLSLAAYRALGAGEKPTPVIIYRQRRLTSGKSVAYDLLVKTTDSQAIRLALANPAQSACRYLWATSLAQGRGILAAGGRGVIEMPMAMDAVGEVQIRFDSIDGQKMPTVEIGKIDPLPNRSPAK